MKVAMVVPLWLPHVGGLQAHAEALVLGLGALGHEVTVLAQEPDRALRRGRDDARTRRFASASPSATYPVAPGLFAHLRRHGRDFDVVHLHGFHAAAAAGILALPAAEPAVLTPHFHGDGHTPVARLMHRAYAPIGRAVVRRADRVIAVSHAEAGLLASSFAGVDARTVVVPNGVRELPSRATRSATPVLVAVARLEAYKRLDRVVDVAAALGEPWQLRIVGSGPDEAAIRRRAADLGIDDRVRIDARLSDTELADVLAGAWAYVSMSEKEAFGLTVLEAAAAGVPVVVSDIPAHRELRGMAPGAVHLAAGDATAVAAQVRALAGTPVDTGWAASLRWPAVCEATVGVYRQAVEVAGSR